ncbi:MAG: metallophosphoesterase, partial [Clostridia bacterium]|nr:metallophosphoesterase [Clostridia bacterium]
GYNNENLIREISKLKPDIIAIAGDMNIESQPDNYASIVDECKELNKVAPVYYSLGNHEIDAMLFSGSNIYKDIKAAGVKILNNEKETVTIGSTNVDVIGLTQRPDEFNKYGKEFFDKAMEENDNFKLVLNHYPENFMGTLDDYPIDLALAGHAHGGQIRLPWIGGLYAADQGFFPKLCDGYHEIGNSRLIITRGLSTSGWMPRINNRPEIAIIDLGWY